MNSENKRLHHLITEADSEKLLHEFAEFGEGASVTDEEQQRILSSVMRKAGFEMNDITVKRTKKHSRRFVGFMVAAAVLGAGAIGAGAYSYSNGMWNAMDIFITEDQNPEVTMENLKSVTSDFDGEILENTFTDLNFTYEGIVNDGQEGYVVLTVKKSNGEPFDLGEDGCAGIAFKRESPKITDGNYDTKLYPANGGYSYSDVVNDDGSVTFMLYITNEALWHDPYYKPNLVDGDEALVSGKYVLSISNIYVYPDNDSYFNVVNDEKYHEYQSDVCVADEENDTEKYDKALSSQFAICAENASECHEGTLTFTVNMDDDHSKHVQTVDGDNIIDVWVSSLSIRAYIANDNGIDAYEKGHEGEGSVFYRDFPLEVHFKEGGSSGEQCFPNDSANVFVYGEEDDTKKATGVRLMSQFNCTINVDEVDYVMVDGHRVDINK